MEVQCQSHVFECMYIVYTVCRVHLFLSMCVYVHVYVCMCVCIFMCICVCMCACMCVCMYVCTCVIFAWGCIAMQLPRGMTIKVHKFKSNLLLNQIYAIKPSSNCSLFRHFKEFTPLHNVSGWTHEDETQEH